uniref:Uncharacterized protein n=1 Tax=Oryzias sinensis TaxID=183150 RepID=A0A8C7YEX6_9TELE
MLLASTVTQQTFVQQVHIYIVVNVPDILATVIPPALLVFPQGTADLNMLNKKTWTPEQITVLVFLCVFQRRLSPYMLQGFTCSGIQNMKKSMILQLIRACRPRDNRPKVVLKESQLTCMYNQLPCLLISSFLFSFLLIHYRSQDIQKNNCRSYFSELGTADFSVVSSVLNKAPQLFREATTCLGINNKSLSKDNVEVLGNMVCTLDGSYIVNSDPYILEKLKACKDFSNSQVAAMETLLVSGNTPYGYEHYILVIHYKNKKIWNISTIDTLGALMKPEDGTWTTEQSKTIITKYLYTSENTLGTTELNMINSYLCSLDIDTLKTINTESIRNAKTLNVTYCSREQKRVLYEITNTSFRTYRKSSAGNFYDLIKGYLGQNHILI